jgi:hypothetical protein
VFAKDVFMMQKDLIGGDFCKVQDIKKSCKVNVYRILQWFSHCCAEEEGLLGAKLLMIPYRKAYQALQDQLLAGS